MGCSCSKATDSVVSEDTNDIRLSGIRESHDIFNGGFVGVDKDNSYEISIRLENMLLIEKDNMVDGSCYVAVYESRKLGNSNKRGFVLVGKTETVTTEPNPEFVKRIPLANKSQDLRFEVYECSKSKIQNINTNPLVGVFECNMNDLVSCKGYYTTPLNPVSIPMFGSIQIYAEHIKEDRGNTNLSLSFSNLAMHPSHPYLVVSRINEDGVRVPIYRSDVFDKNKRSFNTSLRSISPEDSDSEVASPEDLTTSTTPTPVYEDDGEWFSIPGIQFDNQNLLNSEKECQLSFELWEYKKHTRDVFIGCMMIAGSSLGSLYAGEKHPILYCPKSLAEQRKKDTVVMNSNGDRMKAFKEYVEKAVNSIAGCSLNEEDLESIEETATHSVLIPYYSEEYSMQENDETGVFRIDDVSTAFVNTFYDYQGKTAIDFVIGVDMSSSIKQSSKSAHNHDIEEALVDIGAVLSRYDDDNHFCVYGFGCQPDEHEFGLLCSKSSMGEIDMDYIPEAAPLEVMEEEPVQEEVATEVVMKEEEKEEEVVEEVAEEVAEETRSSRSSSSSFHSIRDDSDMEELEETEEKKEEPKVKEETEEKKEETEVKEETEEKKEEPEVKEETEEKKEETEVKEETEEKKEETEVKEETEEKKEEPEVKEETEEKKEEPEVKEETEEKKEEQPEQSASPVEAKPEDVEIPKEPNTLEETVIEVVNPEMTPETIPTETIAAPLSKEEEGLLRSKLFKSQQEADALKRKKAEDDLKNRLELLKSQTSATGPSEVDLDSTQLDMTVFPLNGNPSNPSIYSLENVIKCYRRMLKYSKPSYPTYFQHILKKGIEKAKEAEATKGKDYVVLVLVSDCSIVDEVETTRLIVEASHLPLSIIIVGMGDHDFHFMDVLDGDVKMLSYRGKKASRDMVQFVSFEELRNKSCEEIVSELLSELPRQFMDYMNACGYTPESICRIIDFFVYYVECAWSKTLLFVNNNVIKRNSYR